jgi:AcrR family transcriptional regulator
MNKSSTFFKKQRHDATADILLRAAESVMARKGYERVTMRDIAAQAGCAAGTLYLYFKGKRELVNAILDRHGERLYRRLRSAMDAPDTPLGRLRRTSEAILDYFNENRNFFRVFYSVTAMKPGRLAFDLPPGLRTIEAEIERRELRTIREAQQRGEIRRDMPPEGIQGFRRGITIGLIGEMSHQRRLPPRKEQLRILWGFQAGGIGAREGDRG